MPNIYLIQTISAFVLMLAGVVAAKVVVQERIIGRKKSKFAWYSNGTGTIKSRRTAVGGRVTTVTTR